MPHRPLTLSVPRLKVGLVLDDSLDGTDGVQQYVLTVGEWLRQQGHDVHYLVSETSRDDVENVHALSRNIAVRFNGNRMRMPLPASRFEIRELLEREQFDVLHVQMLYSPFLAGRIIAAASSKTAVVGTFHVVPHSWLASWASRLLALWCMRTLRRFDAVASVSAPAAAFARAAFHVGSTLLPNPIWLERFRSAKPFGRERSDELTLLFLGRLVPRKGCQLLLEAAAILNKEKGLPRFRVLVCGAGPLLGELRYFVRHNGLEDRVIFEGFVSEADKPHYYASADLTVFPSTGGESFGIVLIEAMASGKAAVLAGDNEGYRSVLGACPGDVLFDPHDAKALAEKLRALLTDRAARKHIAEWQRRYVERFDVERIGPQLVTTYLAALRQRRNVR